jgi:hypothetical protein
MTNKDTSEFSEKNTVSSNSSPIFLQETEFLAAMLPAPRQPYLAGVVVNGKAGVLQQLVKNARRH